MERFELLPHLTFAEERQQLAFIGNVPTSPYIRICKQLREGETLSPLVGISAVMGSSAIVDRFRQRYLVADESGKDEQAPKIAFGMAATILKHVRFDDELQEWLTIGDADTTIFEPYFSAHVVKGRTLTTEQLAKLGAKHIGMEQTYLDETRKQWAKHLPDHPEPLEIVTPIAERYIAFVKDRTKSTDHPVMAELTTFFRDGQGVKANEMLAEIGGKTGKDAAEIVWTFRGVLRDENGILCRLFEPLAKLLGWPQSKQRNWYQQVKNLEDLEKARRKRESMRIPK